MTVTEQGGFVGRAMKRKEDPRLIRACAIGLRRIAMWSMPGRVMLSVQFV